MRVHVLVRVCACADKCGAKKNTKWPPHSAYLRLLINYEGGGPEPPLLKPILPPFPLAITRVPKFGTILSGARSAWLVAIDSVSWNTWLLFWRDFQLGGWPEERGGAHSCISIQGVRDDDDVIFGSVSNSNRLWRRTCVEAVSIQRDPDCACATPSTITMTTVVWVRLQCSILADDMTTSRISL